VAEALRGHAQVIDTLVTAASVALAELYDFVPHLALPAPWTLGELQDLLWAMVDDHQIFQYLIVFDTTFPLNSLATSIIAEFSAGAFGAHPWLAIELLDTTSNEADGIVSLDIPGYLAEPVRMRLVCANRYPLEGYAWPVL